MTLPPPGAGHREREGHARDGGAVRTTTPNITTAFLFQRRRRCRYVSSHQHSDPNISSVIASEKSALQDKQYGCTPNFDTGFGFNDGGWAGTRCGWRSTSWTGATPRPLATKPQTPNESTQIISCPSRVRILLRQEAVRPPPPTPKCISLTKFPSPQIPRARPPKPRAPNAERPVVPEQTEAHHPPQPQAQQRAPAQRRPGSNRGFRPQRGVGHYVSGRAERAAIVYHSACIPSLHFCHILRQVRREPRRRRPNHVQQPAPLISHTGFAY